MRQGLKATMAFIGVACACTLAQAQEGGIRYSASLRTGYDATVKDQLNSAFYGFGFGGDYALSTDWAVGAELAYLAQPGRMFRAPLGAPASGRPAADPALSSDGRKNALESLALRASLQRHLGQGLWLVGGLQVGQARFRHEYIGQAIPTNRSYTDTYNGTPTESALKASPYAGLQWRLDEDNALELLLQGRSYRAIDFKHTPGDALVSGSTSVAGSRLVYAGDHLEKHDRMGLVIEFGYRFRF